MIFGRLVRRELSFNAHVGGGLLLGAAWGLLIVRPLADYPILRDVLLVLGFLTIGFGLQYRIAPRGKGPPS